MLGCGSFCFGCFGLSVSQGGRLPSYVRSYTLLRDSLNPLRVSRRHVVPVRVHNSAVVLQCSQGVRDFHIHFAFTALGRPTTLGVAESFNSPFSAHISPLSGCALAATRLNVHITKVLSGKSPRSYVKQVLQ